MNRRRSTVFLPRHHADFCYGRAAVSAGTCDHPVALPLRLRSDCSRRMLGSFSEPEEGPCPRCCSTVLAGADRRPASAAGRPPRNKGLRYPADPPKVEEIVSVMCAAGDVPHERRLRGLIVILWRAG